jgi:hypothetical protein
MNDQEIRKSIQDVGRIFREVGALQAETFVSDDGENNNKQQKGNEMMPSFGKEIVRKLDTIHKMWRSDVLTTETARKAYLEVTQFWVYERHADLFEMVMVVIIPRRARVVPQTRYSDEEMQTLLRLYARGVTAQGIADRLSRSRGSVTQKIMHLQRAGVLPYRNRKKVEK